MIGRVALVAWNSCQENLRSRFYMLTAVFGAVFLYVSLLLGLLAADQELRVLLDFGLGFIELLGLVAALYGACTGILREIETKTIYLILTRPVSRGEYVLGRFAGLMLSVAVAMLLMSAVHLSILFAKGWAWEAVYPAALLGAYLKVFVTAAMALFMSLATTSVQTALTVAGVLWTLGHFLPEIRFMVEWGAPQPLILPLKGLSWVIPDLQLFNLRDRLTTTTAAAKEMPAAAALAYAAGYSGVWLALSRFWMRRKEF